MFELSSGLPQAGPVPAEMQAERDTLVRMSDELLAQVGAALRSQPPTPPTPLAPPTPRPQTDEDDKPLKWM